jgi:Uma2 family endonuclease
MREEQDGVTEQPAEATPEQLLEMEDGRRFELIGGRLVERHLEADISPLTIAVLQALGRHIYPRRLGHLFGPDCGYQIFPEDLNQVRYVRGTFIARGRFPGERAPTGHVRIPPDLAYDLVSRKDTAEAVETKRVAFLRAGVRLLWIIYPENRTIHVCRPGGNLSALAKGDELRGEDVLPEFVCKLSEIFEVL